MARPSIFSSQTKRSTSGTIRWMRLRKASTSSREKALESESMGVRWRNLENDSEGAAPTLWVGESGVCSSG